MKIIKISFNLLFSLLLKLIITIPFIIVFLLNVVSAIIEITANTIRFFCKEVGELKHFNKKYYDKKIF